MSIERESLEECYERLHLMANSAEEGNEQWDLSTNDCWAIASILVEFDCLKKQINELREAVSPGRIAKPEYYIEVAARLRSKDTVIKPMGDATDTERP